MMVFGNSENRCTQGSFLKRMHARVVLGTGARNQKGHFDGCTQRTFGQRMRARYGANPGCAQPTSRMRATTLTMLWSPETYTHTHWLRHAHTHTHTRTHIIYSWHASGYTPWLRLPSSPVNLTNGAWSVSTSYIPKVSRGIPRICEHVMMPANHRKKRPKTITRAKKWTVSAAGRKRPKNHREGEEVDSCSGWAKHAGVYEHPHTKRLIGPGGGCIEEQAVAIPGALFLGRFDWCCFYYSRRNSLVAFLEVLFACTSIQNRDLVHTIYNALWWASNALREILHGGFGNLMLATQEQPVNRCSLNVVIYLFACVSSL